MGKVQFGDARVREAVKVLTAVDGTVMRAVHRMSLYVSFSLSCLVWRQPNGKIELPLRLQAQRQRRGRDRLPSDL